MPVFAVFQAPSFKHRRSKGIHFLINRHQSKLTKELSETPQPMADNNIIEVEGKVISVLPGTMFKVQLVNGHIVLAHISGKLRKNFIKIAAGDSVRMEMSPYDLEKARITYRMRDDPPPGAPRPQRQQQRRRY